MFMVFIVCVGGVDRCYGGIFGINDRYVDRGQFQVFLLGQKFVYVYIVIIWG